MSVNLLGDKRYFTTRNIWRSKSQKIWMKSGHNNTINLYFKSKNKVSFVSLSFDCFNWCWEQVLWLGWTLILNSFPICPQSLLSLISDDISRTELGKGQISIKIVCRIFYKLYRIQMNLISGIGGRRMGSHSAGKFMMTEYQSSQAEGLWSYPAPELRILVSC